MFRKKYLPIILLAALCLSLLIGMQVHAGVPSNVIAANVLFACLEVGITILFIWWWFIKRPQKFNKKGP